MFLSDDGPDSDKGREAPRAMIAGSAVLAAGSVVFGLAPQLVVNYLVNPMLLSLGLAPCIGVSWMGLTVGNGSWFSTAGLAMVVLSLAVGLIAYWMAVPSRRRVYSTAGGSAAAVPVVFSGGDPLAGPARVPVERFLPDR